MRDGRFRRLNRPPPGSVSTPRLAAFALAAPVSLMILFGGIAYLLNDGHPAAVDRGMFSGLLVALVNGLLFSWAHNRRFAAVHLIAGALAIWGIVVWNPVYRAYVAQDPHDVRLRLIDQKPG